jgi:hypothetical protein
MRNETEDLNIYVYMQSTKADYSDPKLNTFHDNNAEP